MFPFLLIILWTWFFLQLSLGTNQQSFALYSFSIFSFQFEIFFLTPQQGGWSFTPMFPQGSFDNVLVFRFSFLVPRLFFFKLETEICSITIMVPCFLKKETKTETYIRGAPTTTKEKATRLVKMEQIKKIQKQKQEKLLFVVPPTWTQFWKHSLIFRNNKWEQLSNKCFLKNKKQEHYQTSLQFFFIFVRVWASLRAP